MATSVARAQRLREQPTPFSTWIDFQTYGSTQKRRQPLPIWLESVQKTVEPANSAYPQKTTIRIRLRRVGQLNNQILFRLFFQDVPGAAPVVTGWSETGIEQYRTHLISSGSGLPTSEALIIPAQNIDYLEISMPGIEANLRGAFLATLRKSEILQALDFAQSAEVDDPFANLPESRPAEDDTYLFGRVKATIDERVSSLTQDAGALSWEFELDAIPLIAVVALEILGVDPLSPPDLIVNDRLIGPLTVYVPDLADPAYQGLVRPLDHDVRFRYTGWLRAQHAVPGSALCSGLNKIVLRLNKQSEPVAVRSVELQLKHHWQHLDYKLVP